MRRALLLMTLALAGCADEETPPPSPDPTAGSALVRQRFPAAGMSLELPRALNVRRREPPGVFRASAGLVYVAGFAYRRSERLPRGAAELDDARRRLVRAVRARGRGYRLDRAQEGRVAGAPAVELTGEQTLSRSRLRIRSVHVYKGDGEFVLELAAPRRTFADFDRRVFEPAVRSLRLSGEI